MEISNDPSFIPTDLGRVDEERPRGIPKITKNTWMACDAEDCGFQMLNDDEIVTSVQEESDPVDDETDEDEGSGSRQR
ncbi:hypothetical protein TNCV_4000261 [Trichonephila clavipes]|nr:hypothetical protein TNCV_4000261 [Trichonephila clavipes]